MISHFKTAFRQLKKRILFTALNTLGLAIGISACWIIFRIVHYEYKVDKEIPQLDETYQIISGDSKDASEDFAGIPMGMPRLLAEHLPEDALLVPVYTHYFEQLFIPQNDGSERMLDELEGIIATQPSYFEMLPYEWIAGHPATALNAPNTVVLTEARAKAYFPDISPAHLLGKAFRADTNQLVVAGVVKALPFPSSFRAEIFVPISAKDWSTDNWHGMNSNHNLYIRSSNTASIDKLLETAQERYNAVAAKDHAEYGGTVVYRTMPLADKHFSIQFDTDGTATDKSTIYGLVAIAGFLLLLACINYINLSTAQMPQRAKEIGIRKTLGARPAYLTWQFITETAMITGFSLLVSWPLIHLFQSIYPEFVPENSLAFENKLSVAGFLILLVACITVLTGLYPSYLINKVQSIEVLKGKLDTHIKGTRLTLRKSLIVFQFVIAQFFIVCALIMGMQLRYTLNKDLGFAHDAVLAINMPYKSYQNGDVDPFLYKRALEKRPEIAGITMGHDPLSPNHWGTILYMASDTGKIQLQTPRKYIDADFMEFYRIQILAGRNLQQTDTLRELLINEATLKELGLTDPAQAVGKIFMPYDNPEVSLPIVGVFKDFHQKSLHTEIGPLILGSSNKRSLLQTFHIRLPNDRASWSETFAVLEKEWKKIYPDAPFTYTFMDERIGNLYRSEQHKAKLIGLATGITIFISCLGLFGLATLTAYQRVKEIGIRKVLGATVTSIVRLFSTDFLKLIGIALLVASPISWWAMSKWLEDFTYRIDISGWIFIVAGVLTIGVALLTISFRAIRAALANPVNSLRDE